MARPTAEAGKKRKPLVPKVVFSLDTRDWARRRDPNPRVRFVPLEGFKADWDGILACGETLDIMWRSRDVLRMRNVGQVEAIYSLPEPEATIDHIRWDGEQLWIVTPEHGIYVISTAGKMLAHLPYGDTLPAPVNRHLVLGFPTRIEASLHLETLGPGKAVVAGNHGPKRRLFVALIERNEAGEFQPRIIHSAARLSTASAATPPDDALDMRFNVRWTLPYTDPQTDKLQVLIGRGIDLATADKPHPRSLVLDAETGKLTLFSAELRLIAQLKHPMVNAAAAGGAIYLLDNGRVLRYDPQLEADKREFRLTRLAGDNEVRFTRTQVLPYKQRLYFPGEHWGCVDLATGNYDQLTRAVLPIHHQYGQYGVSAHYGLVAWNREAGAPVLNRHRIETYNAFSQAHRCVLFQVRIDEPLELSTELEVVPEPQREGHARAAARLRSLGCRLVMDDHGPDSPSCLLTLTDQWSGTDEDLRLIGDLFRPFEIRVHGEKFGNSALAVLGTLPELKTLRLYDTACNDNGLRHLASMPTLYELDLRGPTGWEFTAAGLKHLQDSRIHRLFLSGQAIDNTVLEQLKHHKSLSSLALDDHSVTSEALRDHQRRLQERGR